MRNARFKPRQSKRGVGYAAGGPAADSYRLVSGAGKPVDGLENLDSGTARAAAHDAASRRKRRFLGEVR